MDGSNGVGGFKGLENVILSGGQKCSIFSVFEKGNQTS
jgi:hypothetical protein